MNLVCDDPIKNMDSQCVFKICLQVVEHRKYGVFFKHPVAILKSSWSYPETLFTKWMKICIPWAPDQKEKGQGQSFWLWSRTLKFRTRAWQYLCTYFKAATISTSNLVSIYTHFQTLSPAQRPNLRFRCRPGPTTRSGWSPGTRWATPFPRTSRKIVRPRRMSRTRTQTTWWVAETPLVTS